MKDEVYNVEFEKPTISFIVSITYMLYKIPVMLGFLVSILSETMTTASFLGMGTFFPLCLTSGMVWPQEGMHPALRSVGWLLPLSLSTESIRSLTARGWGIRHKSVYYGFISTLVWIAVFLTLITIVIRVKKGIRSTK